MSIEEKYKYDHAEDKLIVERTQDINPVLKHVEQAKEVGTYTEGLGYYAGTIPAIVIEQYMKEFGVSYMDFIKDSTHIHRIMNDPDYKKFRVWEGTL